MIPREFILIALNNGILSKNSIVQYLGTIITNAIKNNATWILELNIDRFDLKLQTPSIEQCLLFYDEVVYTRLKFQSKKSDLSVANLSLINNHEASLIKRTGTYNNSIIN